MIQCKQLPLPLLETSAEKIDFIYNNAEKFFVTRYELSPRWKSFDIVTNGKHCSMLKQFPEIKEWFDTLENFTGIKNIKVCYVSVLEAKCSIPWHVDDNHDILTKSFITAIRTQSSFIEFKDRCKYTYKTGYSYALNTSQQHRVLNLSNLHRITLCVTPEENKYV